jgi:hypothetical protein
LGIVALLETMVYATNWELEPSFCRARYGFGCRFTTSSLARLGFAANFSRHVVNGVKYVVVVVCERE